MWIFIILTKKEGLHEKRPETLSLKKLPMEVRKYCRKNASVPKRVLIDITRKKQ
jgi:hypothetical protein